MRGGNPPKPATKAKAIELFWKAAESLPKIPPIETRVPEAPQSKAEVKRTPRRRCQEALLGPDRRSRRDGDGRSLLPRARQLAQAMRDANRPLSMAECAELLQVRRASKNPSKIVAWYFARVFRQAGILTESRDGWGA